MNELKTEKAVDIEENGTLTVNEFELESSRRLDARLEQRAEKLPAIPENSLEWQDYHDALDALNAESPRPVIEPLRTWHVGQFAGDIVDVATLTMEWLGKRTAPIRESEIEELRAYLTLALEQDGEN
ncbi:MAG: hypothetical protein KY445_09370 [Armatimonadetes bacterium]|nr:hypothetical protein [Armatimonadota bacterium]